MKTQAHPSNIIEATQSHSIEKAGWTWLKRGWPDFIMVSDEGDIGVVECKPRNSNGELKLDVHQTVMMWLLDSIGLPCAVSDGETWEPFNIIAHGANEVLKGKVSPAYLTIPPAMQRSLTIINMMSELVG